MEKEPVKPIGKLMRNVPNRSPKEPLKPLNDQVQGQTILPLPEQDPDLNSIQESEVDLLMESSSTCLDVSLSDTGIKGTNIFPVKEPVSDEDILQELVDQCNTENNYGPAINPDFNPDDKQWSEKKADVKREQFKKRFTRDTTLDSSLDTVLSRDLIKDLGMFF